MGRRSRVLSEARQRARGDIVAVGRMRTEVNRENRRLRDLASTYGKESSIYQDAISQIHNNIGADNMRVNNNGVWQIARPADLVKKGYSVEDIKKTAPMTRQAIEKEYASQYQQYLEEQRFFAKNEPPTVSWQDQFEEEFEEDETMDFSTFVSAIADLPNALQKLYENQDNEVVQSALDTMHGAYKGYGDLISVVSLAGAL